MDIKKTLFLLLFLFPFVSGKFTITKLNITIHILENGNAHVIEDYRFVLTSEYDHQMYLLASSNNTIANWQDATQLKDFRPHFNIEKVRIANITIRPQPLQQSQFLQEKWYGHVVMIYDLYPYFLNKTLVNETGIVKIKNIKPRTFQFVLNTDAFSFPRTAAGNIILDKYTTLSIILPDRAIVKDVNPYPQNEVKEGPFTHSLTWSATTLNQFTLVFEIEHPVSYEVLKFFEETQKSIYQYVLTDDGKMLIFILLFLFLAFYYLYNEKRKRRG
jgi:hypothetical protein